MNGTDAAGGPYVYLMTMAIPLNAVAYSGSHTAVDLAARKLDLYQKNSSDWTVDLQYTGSSGSSPMAIADTRQKLEFSGGFAIEGITAKGVADQMPNELYWTSRHVFVVPGNWAYELRLTSTDSSVTYGRYGDLDKVLNSLTFNDSWHIAAQGTLALWLP